MPRPVINFSIHFRGFQWVSHPGLDGLIAHCGQENKKCQTTPLTFFPATAANYYVIVGDKRISYGEVATEAANRERSFDSLSVNDRFRTKDIECGHVCPLHPARRANLRSFKMARALKTCPVKRPQLT